MTEIWKPINKYLNYQISSLGRFKNISTGNLLKPFLHPNGYYYISIAPYGRQGKKVTLKLHRLVAEAFIPNIFNKELVNHKDGNKINNIIDNLEWATPQENSTHAKENGLLNTLKGSECEQSILSEDLIEEIRSQVIKGSRQFGVRGLARKYGIAYSTLAEALIGKRTWKHTKLAL